MEGEVEGPSLPSNYVTIQHLKERWLQHHQNPAKSNNPHHHDKRHSPPLNVNPKPNKEAAALKRGRRRRPDRRRFIIPEVTPDDSDSGFKTQIDVVDNHPKGGDKDKKDHSISISNSKLPNKKNSCRGRKPRFADQIPNGAGMELEAPMDKIQTQQLDVRRSRKPVAHNEADGVDDVSIAAAAIQTVTNLSEERNRRRVYERPQVKPKPKPPFGVKKGQTSLVWVKKGESPAN